MYPKEIQEALEKVHARIGDRVRVGKEGRAYEGLLMPKTDMGDPLTIIIKLDSGYNIGVRFSSDVKIEKSRSKEPKEILEEEKFELRQARQPKVSFDSTKPPISLIATGGTIASMVDYRTGGVYAAMKPEELLNNIPELAGFVNVSSMSSPFTVMSEDMMPEGWVEIAKAAHRELNSGSLGVVITHGTDTLHFTSAALSFMLRNLTKPVALVGAQRSSDRGSSDAWLNVVCAARVAIGGFAEVGTCM
ncbi:MAG: asparaginase, partial [Candidatus Aenigmarchaeota archaeon]|nr:asparaginase [Candidatus Aenigmarchaeota archaeon]